MQNTIECADARVCVYGMRLAGKQLAIELPTARLHPVARTIQTPSGAISTPIMEKLLGTAVIPDLPWNAGAAIRWNPDRVRTKSRTRYSKKWHREHGPSEWWDAAWFAVEHEDGLRVSFTTPRGKTTTKWFSYDELTATSVVAELQGRCAA